MGVTGQAAAGWSLTDGMTLWGIGYFCEYGVGCRTGDSRLRGNDVMWDGIRRDVGGNDGIGDGIRRDVGRE